MKLVIGLVGEKLAGKETVGNLLTSYATMKGYTVSRHRTSDVLNATAELWELEKNRANLQALAIMFDEKFGKGTLTRATKGRMERDQKELIILDGIRWATDVEMLRSFPNNFLVYVTASAKTRHQRSLLRKRGKEEQKTFEQFLEEEKVATETQIPKIGQGADFRIVNEISEEKLKELIEDLFYFKLKKKFPD